MLNGCRQFRLDLTNFIELDENYLLNCDGGNPVIRFVISFVAGVLANWTYDTANEAVKQETGKTIGQLTLEQIKLWNETKPVGGLPLPVLPR